MARNGASESVQIDTTDCHAEPRPLDVLVLHGGALGDCVLTLHLIEAMRDAWSPSRITLVARSGIAQWAAVHGLVHQAPTPDEFGVPFLYRDLQDWPADVRLRFQRFDRIINLLGGSDVAMAERLCSVCHADVVNVNPKPFEAAGRDAIHITQQWADQLAKVFQSSVAPTSPALIARSAQRVQRYSSRKELELVVGGQARRIVIVHPGSGGLDKCCPPEVLKQWMTTLCGRGWRGVWMIGPDEVERFGDRYVDRWRATAPVIFEPNLLAAADLVCSADHYIGHDAGMTHVAALAGVPTTVWFGPTDPAVWRPLGPDCTVVQHSHECPDIDATSNAPPR